MFVQMKKILSKLFNAIIEVSKDKLLNFIFGLLITQIVIAVVSTIFNPSYGVAIIGLIVGVVAGIIKEIYYNEQPVWVQKIHGDKATVGFINSDETKDLYIDDLYEKNLYN